jgi:tetratricopeptide (TPR) repeat protein
VPKHNWLFSWLISAGLWGAALPISAQALLPYTPQLNPGKLEEQGIVLAQEAIQLFRFQQYEAALSRAELATQLAPKLYQSWFILGSLYVQQKKFSEGIEVLHKAHALAPQEADIFFSLGNAYFQAGDYSASVKELKQGLSLKPDEIDALFDLGNSYLKLEQYKDAIASYEKAINLEKKFWPAINNIGLVKYEQGDIKGAIALWDRALSIDDQQAEPRLAKAVALYAQGKKAEGLKQGETALTTDSTYGDLEFLRENLWGVSLLTQAKTFLELPEVKSLLTRLQAKPPQVDVAP